MKESRDFHLSNLDEAQHEYLDVILLDISLTEDDNGDLMSPEKVQKDWNQWIEVLEKVKRNGTIEDIKLIIQLIKQSLPLINSFGTFCPIGNLFSFFDTGHVEDGFSLGFEELCLTLMKIFQTYLRLGLEEEEELISNNFEVIEEVINASPNETVVNYFNEKIDKYLEEQAINDLRYMLDA